MFKKYTSPILISCILLLAAILRLYRIGDYMTFLGDEGRDALAVLEILRGHLVFLGPRSSAADFYYGPIYFYMIAPFMWLFGYDPIGAAVFIGLLGVATVYLVYYVGKKFFSEKAGLFAAALYAIPPIIISYSRSSWNPNPLPFVSLLSLYVAYRAVIGHSWKVFLLLGILLGIAIQLQYLALFLIFIIILFVAGGIFLQKEKNSNRLNQLVRLIKHYLTMLLGFLIGWAPFLAFELKHSFPNLRTISTYILRGDGKSIYPDGMGFWQNIESVFFKLFGRLVTRFPPPEQVNVNEDTGLLLWKIGTYLLGFAAVGSLVWWWKKGKERGDKDTRASTRDRDLIFLLCALWLGVGCFLFGFYKREIYDYYLGFMFPLPFLLVGNLLGMVWNIQKTAIVAKISVILLFLVLFLFNLDANPFKFQPNRQKDQVKMISEFVLSKTGGKPYNFALLTKGNSDHGYRFFFEINNRPPTTIENEVVDPKRTSVTDQLMIVCEYTDCQPLGAGLWEVAGFGRAEIAGEWNISVVKVYRLVHFRD